MIIIPARYASTRYPGKPLAVLNGPKTLIQRSWEVARSVPGVDAVYVATDDDRIAEAARGFGAESSSQMGPTTTGRSAVQMRLRGLGRRRRLSSTCRATPRSPLPGSFPISLRPCAPMTVSTSVLRCDQQTLEMLLEDRKAGRGGGTTCVFDAARHALYFSKEVIPYTGTRQLTAGTVPVFHHVGVYAYRSDALSRYQSWETGPLESFEGLEQLRFLENGARMKCVEVDARGSIFWELNNPEDIARIEDVLCSEDHV